MDPDVMVTIALVGYAVLVAIGIGVVLLISHGQRDPGMRDEATEPADARPPGSQAI